MAQVLDDEADELEVQMHQLSLPAGRQELLGARTFVLVPAQSPPVLGLQGVLKALPDQPRPYSEDLSWLDHSTGVETLI